VTFFFSCIGGVGLNTIVLVVTGVFDLDERSVDRSIDRSSNVVLNLFLSLFSFRAIYAGTHPAGNKEGDCILLFLFRLHQMSIATTKRCCNKKQNFWCWTTPKHTWRQAHSSSYGPSLLAGSHGHANKCFLFGAANSTTDNTIDLVRYIN
jgi:hypothetical protein